MATYNNKEGPIVNVAPYTSAQYGPQAGPSYADRPISKSRSRALRDIFVACLVIAFPMILLSALLLAFIYTNLVKQATESPAALRLPDNGATGGSAYLIDFSATRLVTIASLSSSVAPFLPGFILTLLSFPAARRMFSTSKAGLNASLPTPYQIGLYVQLLDGSGGALWLWLKYRFWSKREKQAPVITTLVAGLLAATFIGYAILAADTWLHVVTSTVLFNQITSVSTSSTAHSFGRGFYSSDCGKRPFRETDPCTITNSASTTFLIGAGEAYATLNNLSTVNQIRTFTHDSKTYSALLPAQPPQNLDYRAFTFAVSTSCAPVSKVCNLKAQAGAFTPFNCTPAFAGDLTNMEDLRALGSRRASSPVGFVLLASPTADKNITYGSLDANPFDFGTWALVDTPGMQPNASSSNLVAGLSSDPEIVQAVHGGLGWVLKCQTSVYDLTYTLLNNSIVNPVLTLSNASTGGIFAAPTNNDFGLPNMEIAAKTASFSGSAQELATKWANAFSSTALGLSAGVMSPRPNLVEQTRAQKLVARVPKAPLYVLVLLNLLYAAMGIVLAVYAALFTRIWGGTGAARQRLTVPGLAATAFEDQGRARLGRNKIEEAFGERDGGASARVGVGETGDEGMRFTRVG